MPLLPNMRFRVFLKRSEGRMCAIGVDPDESTWLELWGALNEPTPYCYRFTHSRERARSISDWIESALAENFLEVLKPTRIANWHLFCNEDHTLTLIPIASASDSTLAIDQVIETQVPGIVPADDAAIEAAGYRQIGI